MVRCEERMKKGYLKKIGMVSTLKRKKRKTSKFVDERINNWKEERRELITWNGSTGKNGEEK